jgi:hypothetical protein
MMAVVCMGARTPRAPILRALKRKDTEFEVYRNIAISPTTLPRTPVFV